MKIQQYRDNLYLIILPVPIEGFNDFVSAWLLTGEPTVLVDVGPAVTVPHLLSALTQINAANPDVILLTHIHMDHAGGVGQVASAFPEAAVVCHAKAVEHLIAPERLWQGSVKTLGAVARAYQRMAPLSADRVVIADHFHHGKITCIPTPGHAVHHMSYQVGDLLFAGEVGGVHLPVDDGLAHYLRPATPPRFFLETTIASIDRVLADGPRHICYGHIGLRSDGAEMLKIHRDQLQRWREMIHPFFDRSDGPDDTAAMKTCLRYLLANDPLLAGFSRLPSPERQRETFFLLNSLKGYWGYLDSIATTPGR